MTPEDRPVKTDNQWHLSKSVNISVILAIFVSWGSAFYFFGDLQRSVDSNTKKISELRLEDLKELKRDVDTLEDIVNDHNAILSRMNETLSNINVTLNRLETKINDNTDNIPR